MKGKTVVVFLSLLLILMLASCMQQIAPSSEQGFLVRIAPSGKIVSAVNWDSSKIRYASDEKRRITDARLAFFEQEGKEPSHYLKKVKGKWQKTAWKAEALKGGTEDIAKGIIVHVAPDGTISRIMNMDGSKVKDLENINFKNARLATRNVCCWGTCYPGYACCLCKWCPGGKC
jgi:hypothetical protein